MAIIRANRKVNSLPDFLQEKYELLKEPIRKRLKEFEEVPADLYFYELCFCVCTPQSKAKSALVVQKELERLDFLNNDIDPTPILRQPENYIRFHNQKTKRLLLAKVQFPEIMKLLNSDKSSIQKRMWFVGNFNGFGMKESAHFLRNIGYKELGILDRHILKHLHYCGVYKEIPKITTRKSYEKIEKDFREYSYRVGIPMDELDLLFWSYEAGEILK